MADAAARRDLNALITRAQVCLNDRDILSLIIEVEFSDGMSGMLEGHHALYLPPSYKHSRPLSLLGQIVWHWLNVTDCTEVSQMIGKVVRVRLPYGMRTTPSEIGHVIKDDRWFSTSEICAKATERES